MTRVLLISPPVIDVVQGPIPGEITAISCYPPLHLMYIAAHAKKIPNVDIKIVDSRIDNLSYADVEKIVQEYRPHIVGITVNTFSLISALTTSKIVKQLDPKTIVVFGGVHPTIYPAEAIRYETVDALVLGEGELTFKDFVQAVIAGSDLTAVQGVVTKQTEYPERVQPQMIQDLDTLEYPAWDLVDALKYKREGKPVLWLLSSRGCVGRCTFCYIHESNRKFRPHSAQYVFNNLKALHEKYGLEEFFIADDCFTISKRRVIDFCKLLLDSGLKLRWGAVSRCDTINEEVVKIMAESGCMIMYLGIETGDQRIQKVIRKNLDLEKVRQAIALVSRYKLNPHATFMIGHPQETEKEIATTLKFMKSLKLSGIAGGVAIFEPFPNTISYLEGLQSGFIKTDFWREFARAPTKEFKNRFWNECLSDEQLLSWQKKVNNGFYFRPIIVYRTLLEAIRTRRLKSKISSFLIYLKIIAKSLLPASSRAQR